jgi:hypothetical protein
MRWSETGADWLMGGRTLVARRTGFYGITDRAVDLAGSWRQCAEKHSERECEERVHFQCFV